VSLRSAVVVPAAAAYAALAALVAAGELSGLDQWAVDRAMPGLRGTGHTSTTLEAIVPLLHAHWRTGWDVASNLVTLPGQSLVSLVVVALVVRRVDYLVALVAGDVVEVLCKHTLVRPPLYRHGVHIAPFDTSFPSGHALRVVLVAAALAAVLPRARAGLVAWAAAAIVLLELAGDHTPSDILGALLLAALLLGLLGARAATRRRRA
jgi:membrane-associated phospholipid phosphatase